MNPLIYLIPAVGTFSFVAGIVFSKAVLTEADSIKAHVSDEIKKLRGDISAAIKAKL